MKYDNYILMKDFLCGETNSNVSNENLEKHFNLLQYRCALVYGNRLLANRKLLTTSSINIGWQLKVAATAKAACRI